MYYRKSWILGGGEFENYKIFKMMNWINVNHRLPLDYLDKKIWLYNSVSEYVYDGYINATFKNNIYEYLKKNNISHWLPYYPDAPNKNYLNEQLIEDDSVLIGTRSEVAECLLYNFVKSMEDADNDKIIKIAQNFADIMKDINSNSDVYVRVDHGFMCGSFSIYRFSNSFSDLHEEWFKEQ